MYTTKDKSVVGETHPFRYLTCPYSQSGAQSFGLGGIVTSGLENESTVDHPGNAVVKALTPALTRGSLMGVKQTPHNKIIKCIETGATPPIFDLSLLTIAMKPTKMGSQIRRTAASVLNFAAETVLSTSICDPSYLQRCASPDTSLCSTLLWRVVSAAPLCRG
jgi:hypothetical protein